MDAAELIRRARRRSGMTLRELAARVGTSHSTLSAYEHGRKTPTVDTLDRILRAAGLDAGVEMRPLVGGPARDDRGRELVEALELAALFPARHAPRLDAPKFGRRT